MSLTDWAVIAAPVSALFGVALGAWLTYSFAWRQKRRESMAALFDRAIASIGAVQAARKFATQLPPEYTKLAPEAHEEFQAELRKEGIRAFIHAAGECRSALAAVYPYCPQVLPFVSRFEVAEDEMDSLIGLLLSTRGRLHA